MLDSTQIDLWCARLPDIHDASLLQVYQSLMSDSERAQHQRFVFAKDRHRYLVTRALVRTVLSRYADIAPKDWVFVADSFGKPHLANWPNLNVDISFNISHSDQLILVGVTRGRALGLDTENWRDRVVTHDIADRFFSPVEAADLKALPLDQQQYRFFEYWTLKESYIKARGMGLSIPLDQFSFRFPQEGAVELMTEASLNDVASRWRFAQFVLNSDYLISLCLEKINHTTHHTTPQLVLKETVPLRSEKVAEFQLVRVSEDF